MTNTPKGQVSFVFPVYNEERVIETTLREFSNEFTGKLDFELIVAEDGSTDSTKQILKSLEPELGLKLYLGKDRKGYLRAVREALQLPKSEWVFLSDSDNQFDPHDFWRLWPYTATHDIILGRKTNRKDGPLRAFLSGGYNTILRIMFGVPYRDMDTGFRLFRRQVVEEIAPSVETLGFFTAEFVIKAHNRGHRIIEIPVRHFKQEARASNIFHLDKLPRIILRELKAIYKLWKELRNTNANK